MASKNDLLGDNEEKILKRERDTNNSNNNNNNVKIELSLEGVCPLKNQKIEQTSGAITNSLPMQMGGIEMLDDVVSHFFFHAPISGIRAGRCVSKPLQQLLMSDDFCNYWGMHFSPSTPKAMGMTPQDFIRYWSTPSFEIMENILGIKGMSADATTIVGFVYDSSGLDKFIKAVQW